MSSFMSSFMTQADTIFTGRPADRPSESRQFTPAYDKTNNQEP